MIEGVAMKKKKVKLNKKQQQAVDLILSGVNVFLTGDAGTGKTTVVQQSVKALEKDEKNVLIAATTGVAADNIGMGAVTVHKAFGLGIEFEKYKDAPGFRSSYLQEADVVIIDEIGMCRFDLFSAIVKNIIAENNKRFPIKIAWAMSIHKSQGQTFGQVNIDPRCWDSGQFYVAVSRAESVAGIHFMDLIRKQYIRTLSDEVIKILKESLYSII